MDPKNQGAIAPDQGQTPVPQMGRPFTEKALNAKFSFSFTRCQLLSLSKVFSSFQIRPIDPSAKDICDIVDEIDRTAFKSLTESDYEKPAKAATPPIQPPATPANNIKVN